MHYYNHHIGDFNRDTRHLTRLERSIYRDLIELYYETEIPLTLDMAALCRRIIAKSNEEATTVEQVLNEFFNKTDIGWYHSRCEEEIERFRTSSSQKSAAGKASAAKRAEKLRQAISARSTTVEIPSDKRSTNQEPITNNQSKQSRPSAKTPAICFKSFVDQCQANNEKLVSNYRPIYAYAEKVSLPEDFIVLAWNEFYRRYHTGGHNENKKYKDWRRVFLRCVEENWFKIWWFDPKDNTYKLTTQGHSIERAA